MNHTIESLTKEIVASYAQHQIVSKIDSNTQPSREVVIHIIDDLQKLVFPGYFEVKHLKSSMIDFYVGNLLEEIIYNLKKQIVKALRCCDHRMHLPSEDLEREATQLCQDFLKQIPDVQDMLESDVNAAYDGDPAAYSKSEIIYSYPGLYAIMVYRLAHELFQLKVPLIPRIMTEHAHNVTGIDIHPGATIGRSFFIDHGTGIVIGETTVIGEHVKIYQGVTLGGLSTDGGQTLKGTKRHPTIEDNVTIYSGVSILGGDTVIGSGSLIGGNTFVTDSIPRDTRVIAKTLGAHHSSTR